jgi:uncharacterized UBP type Zn finger protein
MKLGSTCIKIRLKVTIHHRYLFDLTI